MNLTISQILLGDASFAHTGDFLAAVPKPIPPSSVALELGLIRGEEPLNLAVHLRVKMDTPSSPYRLNVSYFVLMSIDELPNPIPPDFDRRLIATGVHMAYPYAREVVSNLTARGRFGPIWLSPMDINEVLKGIPETPPPAEGEATKKKKTP